MQEFAMTVRSRLKVVIAEYNVSRLKAGHDALGIREIAVEVGLAPSIITGLTTNRTRRVDYQTLNKLCAFFKVQPGDLLEYVPDESDK